MSRTTALVAAWLAAAVVGIFVASAAVGAVRDNVSEVPQPLSAALPSTTATTTTPPPTQTGSSTVTTAPATTTIPPSTTVPEATTTSPPAAGGMLKTYTITGGTVSIEVFTDHLVLLGAVPAAGYTVEEKSSSARKIEIEFRSGEHESKFVAALENDGLEVTTEGDEGEDD